MDPQFVWPETCNQNQKEFWQQFSFYKPDAKGAYQTVVGKALTWMEHGRRMTMTADDVRFAAVSCGFSDIPRPLRHQIKGRDKFARLTRDILCDDFRSDVRMTEETLRHLSFLFDVLIKDAQTKFSVVQTQEGSPQKWIELESPRGIQAQFVQMDWDLLDQFDDDQDNDYEGDDDDDA